MMKRKTGTTWVFALMLAAALMLCGCAGQGKDTKAAPEESGSEVDYMVLVNSENPLPEDWLDRAEFCASINSVGDDVFVEAEAYKAYLELKKDVEKELQDRKVTLEEYLAASK